MLYILGGASRSGKTLLSRRATEEKHIPYFPLDALFLMLVRAVPEKGVTHESTFYERSSRMWPLVKPLLNSFLEEEKDYLVEGDSIIPSQVKELIDEGSSVKACFVGYAHLTRQEKLALVREYHQGDIDWTRNLSDEKMLPMIDEMIEFSKYLEEECSKYEIPYFDISHDFEGVRDKAFEYLFSK